MHLNGLRPNLIGLFKPPNLIGYFLGEDEHVRTWTKKLCHDKKLQLEMYIHSLHKIMPISLLHPFFCMFFLRRIFVFSSCKQNS